MCGIDTRERVLVATGRISSEMLTKAAKMGVPVVVSRTSPTWLSIRLAEAWGIAVCGYTRARQTNIYAHPERIIFDVQREDRHGGEEEEVPPDGE
jgi:FdhD protein